jgi:hypothetical protein
MDNGAISTQTSDSLLWAFNQLDQLFGAYCFPLQKFISNDCRVNEAIKMKHGESPAKITKLLGLNWDTEADTIYTDKFTLDPNANTKRKILSSIAENYDVFNYNGPVLNRARLFLHMLQCRKDLKWDGLLPEEELREWRNITVQLNNASPAVIQRCIGSEDDTYQLIACTDSSKDICGIVIYILNNNTNQMHFLIAKNKIVGKQLENKTIPCLELVALTLGVETLIDVYNELCDSNSVKPMKFSDLKVFTDSYVCLNWLQGYHTKFVKTNKLSVFVKNRIIKMNDLCKTHIIQFRFCSGVNNPADYMTRAFSYKQVMNSNFYTGLSVEFVNNIDDSSPSVIIPNPLTIGSAAFAAVTCVDSVPKIDSLCVIDSEKISIFYKLVKVGYWCLKYLQRIKLKLIERDSEKYKHFEILSVSELRSKAYKLCILQDQRLHFGQILDYFKSTNKLLKDAPSLIGQLNVFRDPDGILRVKAKFKSWRGSSVNFPVLLSKSSDVTKKIIFDLHLTLNHAGIYSVLTEIRKTFWIPHIYSVVKSNLKSCVHCRKLNNRPFVISQNTYRHFRSDPLTIPFRTIFIDHCGPYYVYLQGTKVKVYLLLLSCLWSRGVNIKLCLDLSVKTFLRALQLHVYEYGLPELVMSDCGSQLCAGAKIINNFLQEPDTKQYMDENSINMVKFEQFPKGKKELGGLIEIMVKLVKRLLSGSVGNLVLDYFQFEFLVIQACNLVNKRPIAYKSSLRDTNPNDYVPEPITPEILIKGYNLVTLNLIPNLQHRDPLDPEWYLRALLPA